MKQTSFNKLNKKKIKTNINFQDNDHVRYELKT